MFTSLTQNGFQSTQTALRALFLAVALISALQVPAMAEPPSILITNGEQSINTLTIGDDLYTGLTNAAPLTSYDIYLRDESDSVVAVTTVLTDNAGYAAPELLLERSGVLGCGPGHDPDGIHRFSRFEEAENVLGGRTFRLEVLDSDVGIELVEAFLHMIDEDKMTVYFGDCNECPIFERTRWQTLFVSAANLSPTVNEMRIFVVQPLGVNTALTDLRPAYSAGQVIAVSPSVPLHAALWTDPDYLPNLEMIVRISESGPTDPSPFFSQGDYKENVTITLVEPCSGRVHDEGTEDCSAC